MISRYQLSHGRLPFLQPRARGAATGGYGRAAGWWLIGGITVMFLGWLAYRWLAQPDWPALLPPLLAESLALVETATAFTLSFVWLGLGWRWRKAAAAPDIAVLTVEQLYALDPTAFERYVAGLFRRKGYRVHMRGGSGDAGVDLELVSALGRRAIVQCKRYQSTIGPDVVRELYGTMIHERVLHAFLVTTADISASGREWARGKPMTLIDGQTLAAIVKAMEGRGA